MGGSCFRCHTFFLFEAVLWAIPSPKPERLPCFARPLSCLGTSLSNAYCAMMSSMLGGRGVEVSGGSWACVRKARM